ncbi:hypothetical protein OAU10_00295 [Saprospiraceae bacterium]|jgi:hypothetical protein|nr:hypothetical protein [bacterium]MDC3209913.1 hypothetical protein [Saprospiraceae bacterium]MDC3253473.1 hypothetical protein [bacterium]MDG1434449.1 hypothetical protein [Saprospiraceae bacterium]
MLHQLNNLPDEELQELYDAIPVITLLIAGADGDIEGSELEQSEKITKIRGFSGGEIMQDFYDHIGKDYKERLTRWAKIVPKDTAERNADLSARLEKLNPILAKLTNHLGAEMYHSFTTFAKHVAKASGGFWGFASINKEEAELINLPMITPIIKEEEGGIQA